MLIIFDGLGTTRPFKIIGMRSPWRPRSLSLRRGRPASLLIWILVLGKKNSWLDRGATFFFGLMIFYKENQRTSAATLMFYKENQCTSGATLMFYKENQCTSVYFLTFTKENRRFFTLLAQTEVRVIRVINFPNQYSSFLSADHPWLIVLYSVDNLFMVNSYLWQIVYLCKLFTYGRNFIFVIVYLW